MLGAWVLQNLFLEKRAFYKKERQGNTTVDCLITLNIV
jgi:hypothetical protein